MSRRRNGSLGLAGFGVADILQEMFTLVIIFKIKTMVKILFSMVYSIHVGEESTAVLFKNDEKHMISK